MPRKVLVADDDQLLVALLQEALEGRGYQVFTAFDGMQAIDQIRREAPDYLILDLVMPQVDGIQLCQHLKEDPNLRSIPITVLTGTAPESAEWLSRMQADAFVAKRAAEAVLQDLLLILKAFEDGTAPPTWACEVRGLEDIQPRRIVTELLSRTAHLNSLLQNLGEGIVFLDPEHRVLYANPAGAALLQHEERDLVGTPLSTILEASNANPLLQTLEQLRTRGGLATERLVYSQRGRTLHFTLTNFLREDRDAGQLLLIRDVSHLVRRIEELAALNELGTLLASTLDLDALFRLIMDRIQAAIENARLYAQVKSHAEDLERKVAERTRQVEAANARLEEALARAERASDHKSAFLANVSHELRTPLNTILGFSEVLQDQLFDPLTEKQARHVRNIHRAGDQLLELIKDLLDLSKVEAGRVELHRQEIRIGDLIADAIAMTRNHADKKSLTVEFLPEDVLPSVNADPYRVTQILTNLLSNAVKFTPSGGTVTVSARHVQGSAFRVQGSEGTDHEPSTMNYEPRRDFVEIRVQDTGIGISLENQAKLFQPFERLEASLPARYEGTGLGLAIAKRLAEMHDGRIRVESEGEGKGSAFIFALPVAPEPTNTKA